MQSCTSAWVHALHICTHAESCVCGVGCLPGGAGRALLQLYLFLNINTEANYDPLFQGHTPKSMLLHGTRQGGATMPSPRNTV